MSTPFRSLDALLSELCEVVVDVGSPDFQYLGNLTIYKTDWTPPDVLMVIKRTENGYMQYRIFNLDCKEDTSFTSFTETVPRSSIEIVKARQEPFKYLLYLLCFQPKN